MTNFEARRNESELQKHEARQDSAEDRSDAIEEYADELMQRGEVCDPFFEENVREAMMETISRAGNIDDLSTFLRLALPETGTYLRTLVIKYWREQAISISENKIDRKWG